jgi:hypothetical protein
VTLDDTTPTWVAGSELTRCRSAGGRARDVGGLVRPSCACGLGGTRRRERS